MQVIQRFFHDAAGVALALLCAVILGDAALAALTGEGIPGGRDLVRNLLVAVIALPLGAATAARGHLALSVVSDRLGLAEQARMILLGHAAGLLALLPLIAAVLWVLSGRDAMSGSGTVGLVLLLAGLVMMWLRLALMLAADLREFRATGMISGESGQGAI